MFNYSSLTSTAVAATPHVTSLPASSVTVLLSSPSTLPCLASVATTSRTTVWRHRKREAEASASCSTKKPRVQRQGYTCRICGEPMNKSKWMLLFACNVCSQHIHIFTATSHTQFRGQRYCPNNASVSAEEWLSEKRKAAITKKATENWHYNYTSS